MFLSKTGMNIVTQCSHYPRYICSICLPFASLSWSKIPKRASKPPLGRASMQCTSSGAWPKLAVVDRRGAMKKLTSAVQDGRGSDRGVGVVDRRCFRLCFPEARALCKQHAQRRVHIYHDAQEDHPHETPIYSRRTPKWLGVLSIPA